MDSGDFSIANARVTAVLITAVTCGEEIKNVEATSCLIKKNNDFYQLAAIPLGFTRQPVVN